jgi:hypothetical protein
MPDGFVRDPALRRSLAGDVATMRSNCFGDETVVDLRVVGRP